jgi:hypothetical protein
MVNHKNREPGEAKIAATALSVKFRRRNLATPVPLSQISYLRMGELIFGVISLVRRLAFAEVVRRARLVAGEKMLHPGVIPASQCWPLFLWELAEDAAEIKSVSVI